MHFSGEKYRKNHYVAFIETAEEVKLNESDSAVVRCICGICLISVYQQISITVIYYNNLEICASMRAAIWAPIVPWPTSFLSGSITYCHHCSFLFTLYSSVLVRLLFPLVSTCLLQIWPPSLSTICLQD